MWHTNKTYMWACSKTILPLGEDFHSDMWTCEQIFTLTYEHENILNRVWPMRLRAWLLTHPVTNKMWHMWQWQITVIIQEMQNWNWINTSQKRDWKLGRFYQVRNWTNCQKLSDQKLRNMRKTDDCTNVAPECGSNQKEIWCRQMLTQMIEL